MTEPLRRVTWNGADEHDVESLLTREWLVTNALGGYASGSLGGVSTRRYHGLLIAALPAPLGRMVMLGQMDDRARLSDGRVVRLGGLDTVNAGLHIPGARYLTEFRLEAGIPVWRYEFDGYVVERCVFLPRLQNTVHVIYTLLKGEAPLRLLVRPAMHFRPHEEPVTHAIEGPYTITISAGHYELSAGSGLPPLRLGISGPRTAFTLDQKTLQGILYRQEQMRGYEHVGRLWTPGYFRAQLGRDRSVTLTASTEPWDTIGALAPLDALEAERDRRGRLITAAPRQARTGMAAELVLSADQFIITPAGRSEEVSRAHAAGDEVRTVIAGYHWFTDWGRDTMISLEGLTLLTGRETEAGYILRAFGHYVQDGLIPNMFPEGEKQGLYHTADATLWFFHAIDRYLRTTEDRATLRHLLPTLVSIVEHHVAGTRFGIHVDPADGLIAEGQPGYALTWMDAKVGDWVVTPRRGKPVEINALWYNALRLLEEWLREEHNVRLADEIGRRAEQAYESFNARFWYEQGGYLYDLVDGDKGDDPACRPNQIFSIALPHPVLQRDRREAVFGVVRDRLLTPVGLRTIEPGHPHYKKKYFGDLRARDAAYHQGTVWPWLIGPFVSAWLTIHPNERDRVRDLMRGFDKTLEQACIGTIAEIFDADQPFIPRGCIAQAWSVAEVLRAYLLAEAAVTPD